MALEMGEMADFVNETHELECADYDDYIRMPYGTCCCGLSMNNHPPTEEHQPRDMKEYIINKYVSAKIGGNDVASK